MRTITEVKRHIERAFSGEAESFTEKIVRFAHALKEWRRRGYKLATFGEIRKRNSTCETCEYSKPRLVFGILSGCAAPGCGCTKLKLVLATSFCPHPAGQKWGISKVLQTQLQKA